MIWSRIKNLWRLSSYEVPPIEQGNTGITNSPLFKPKQYAEFIRPNRIEEIFTRKPSATIDDVL